MDAWADLLEAAEELRVVAERKIRVEPVDDVKLGERLVRATPELVPRLFERHRIRRGIGRLQAREGAEQATRHAHVRRLETKVVVEIGARAMPFLAFAIRERADRQQVVAFEQAHTVGKAQAFPCFELVADAGQSGCLDAGFHLRASEILACYTARLKSTPPGEQGKWV